MIHLQPSETPSNITVHGNGSYTGSESLSLDEESGRMKRTLRFKLSAEGCPVTIRDFLRSSLHFSKRQISSLKYREDGIRVNGQMQRVSYVLQAGDVLEIVPKSAGSLYLDHGTFTEPPEILYEDGDLLIVNKPSGMVCHPSPGHYADSLANQAAAYCAQKKENWTIRVVGRLDKDTSGVVIFAKSSEAAALMSQKIAVEKTYYALAEGTFEKNKGKIDLPVAPDGEILGKMKIDEEGKDAETYYELVAASSFSSLLKIHIVHGRTHQIRIHMSAIHHPLVGDPMYGHGKKGETHAMLHCRSVRFSHPFTGEVLVVSAPFPDEPGWRIAQGV